MKKATIQPVNQCKLIYNYVKIIFPLVKEELHSWQERAKHIPDSQLSQQALESIGAKAFHCQGGSIYALYPGVDPVQVVRFIVAYQTMSDYLDNLVDNLEVQDEQAFFHLHKAMYEALTPDEIPIDYYLYYPYKDDGGYLESLVKTCQESLKILPSYLLVMDEAISLAKLYSHLQTYKHLAKKDREEKLLNWIEPYLKDFQGTVSWELAAATGSTLGIFCLYAISYNPNLTYRQVKETKQAYFPWISGLHILLDYFIDLKEDRETHQLNFVSYYEHAEKTSDRLALYVTKSLEWTSKLDYPNFHQIMVHGLLAMYLSDEKSKDLEILSITNRLLRESGYKVRMLHWICGLLRKRDLL